MYKERQPNADASWKLVISTAYPLSKSRHEVSRGEEQTMPLQVGTLHMQGGDDF